MYSKREVCFTVIATLAVLWYLGPPKAMAKGEDRGVAASFGDGTHPPPPPWLINTDMLRADGTHPPPPPPTPPQSLLGNTEMLQADGTHPPPPPPPLLVNTEILQADGTHPPPPPWRASAMQAG
jgi:hypothetical protein